MIKPAKAINMEGPENMDANNPKPKIRTNGNSRNKAIKNLLVILMRDLL